MLWVLSRALASVAALACAEKRLAATVLRMLPHRSIWYEASSGRGNMLCGAVDVDCGGADPVVVPVVVVVPVLVPMVPPPMPASAALVFSRVTVGARLKVG